MGSINTIAASKGLNAKVSKLEGVWICWGYVLAPTPAWLSGTVIDRYPGDSQSPGLVRDEMCTGGDEPTLDLKPLLAESSEVQTTLVVQNHDDSQQKQLRIANITCSPLHIHPIKVFHRCFYFEKLDAHSIQPDSTYLVEMGRIQQDWMPLIHSIHATNFNCTQCLLTPLKLIT